MNLINPFTGWRHLPDLPLDLVRPSFHLDGQELFRRQQRVDPHVVHVRQQQVGLKLGLRLKLWLGDDDEKDAE